VDDFVRDLLARQPIEAAEERALARLARTGDPDARAALITAGMRSVVLRARLRGLGGEELRDAVQSGAIGLIRAIDRFDPDRGVRLATYAWHFIGAEMHREVLPDLPLGDLEPAVEERAAWSVDLLEGLPEELAAVIRMRFGLAEEAPVPMSRIAVAQHLGLSVAQVRTIEGKAMRQLRKRLAKVVDRAPPQRGADPP
jgi:DNA-directed RNA polymerase sigma subunit (sigma70/sigma32)